MRMKVICCLLVLASAAQAQDVPVLEAVAGGRVEPVGEVVTDAQFSRFQPWWSNSYSARRADYMRAEIAIRGDPAPPGTVLVAEGWEDPVRTYDISDRSGETFWTGIIRGSSLFISIEGPTKPEGVEIEILNILRQLDRPEVFSHWNGNQLQEMDAPDLPEFVRQVSPTVAWLNFIDRNVARNCTGVLLSEDVLLTNEHCINTEQNCQSLIATFGFEKDTDGRIGFGEEFTCAGFNPENVNFVLDAALIKLNGQPGATWGFAQLSTGEEDIANAPLAIIQHPDGRAKEVSLVDCALMAAPINGRGPDTDFSHTCDTEGGSSGAPVFDSAGKIVGLHHFGFNDAPNAFWTENRAVRLAALRAWLNERLPGLEPGQ